MTALAPSGERSIYVWIASVLFFIVCNAWQPVGGVAWNVTGWWRGPLMAMQLLGLWLTLRGAAVLDFFELAGIRENTGTTEFRTTGPYGLVRHPIYLGWFLLVWPVATMTMTRVVFAVISCLYLVVAIPFEEGTLRRASGGAYDGYAKQVRWRLLPDIY